MESKGLKSGWDAIPNEIVEHIFSFVIANELRTQWHTVPLINFEAINDECGTKCSYIWPLFRQLQFERRCRRILKAMCVFKLCPQGDSYGGKMEYDFKRGLLHK
jgi:hypothetical protein